MTGQEVKKILNAKHITQVSVAENMGVSVQNLQQMLKVADIKTTTLERISKASGIPIAEFLGCETNMTPTEFIKELKAQRESYESIIKDLMQKIK